MGAVARVEAAETGWGQRQCQQPETPALSYSREQVMNAPDRAGSGILLSSLSHLSVTISFICLLMWP